MMLDSINEIIENHNKILEQIKKKYGGYRRC